MTRGSPGGAVLALLAGLAGAVWVWGPQGVAWAERVLCADGRLEAFTQFQLGVNLLVLVALAGMAWRYPACRAPVLERGPGVGWMALGCGLVPVGLYAGSFRFRAWAPWFAEHGWLEWTTPILALAAGVLFVRSACQRRGGIRPDPAGAVTHAGLAAGAFLLAMEELNWGQVIFGWPTSEIFFSGNLQDATNLHNFFNPAFPVLYELAGWALGGAMYLSIRRPIPTVRRGAAVLLPPPALAGLVLLAFLFRFSHELFEQLLAWVLVFHAGIDAGAGACGAPARPRPPGGLGGRPVV